jgi:5-methylcytosine-specific restriction endonuclease McrA
MGVSQLPQGIKLTKKGLMKFDVNGRARKNWVSEFKHKSRKFLKKECELCGSKENLTIHHKEPVTSHRGILKQIRTVEELNYRVLNEENCQTLCRKCHDKVHGFIK